MADFGYSGIFFTLIFVIGILSFRSSGELSMRIWDSIRRLTGNTFRKQSTRLSALGILKNKKAQKRQLQIEQFEDRILLSINSPQLNAIFVNQDENQYFDPAATNQVYHIAPESFLLRFNEGQEIDPATLATGIQVVRAGTDGKFDTADDVIVDIGWIGINGSRGDGNDVITNGDAKTLAEGLVGNEVIIRFAETLPDDLYQFRLIGSGNTPLKNLNGDVFHDETDQAVSFELDLGAQVVATVPQPTYRGTDITFLAGNQIKDGDRIVISNGRSSTTFEFDNNAQSTSTNVRVTFTNTMTATQVRDAFLSVATPYLGNLALTGTSSGTNKLVINGYGNSVTIPAGSTQFILTEGSLGQARDKVVLYFNANDPLYFPGFDLSATNAMARSYSTTNADYLKLFQLIATQNTTDSADDIVHYPTKIEYVPATGEMVLTFAGELDQLNGFGDGVSAARLRVGTLYEKTNTTILDVNSNDLPGDAYHTSFELASYFDTTTTVTGPQSLIIHGQIDPKFDPIEYTGARDEPGHRDLPIGLGLGTDNHINGDTLNGNADTANGPTIRYYNFKTILGYDGNNQPYLNSINEAQKDLTRQIYQLYSRYLGIEFIEDTDLVNPRGTTIATGDLRFFGPSYSSVPGGVAGLGNSANVVIDMAETWVDVYGGNWFQTALHEIGHSIGLGHTYDLPNGTTMGSTSLIEGVVKENTFPGDFDILHGQHIYRPDSTDVDLYKFVVEPGQRGMFSAEIFAQRQNAASLLDTTLTLYRQITETDGSIYYEMVSRNDDYFGKDSFLEMYLSEGTYFIGVASAGNDQYAPEIEGTGEGGTTSGNYELRLTFTPGGVDPNNTTTYKEEASKTTLVDATGVKFDGDHDRTPGGEFNFWFNVQTQDKTIYVDKLAATGGDGSINRPYKTIKDAISNASEGDIIRIVGNNFSNDDINLTDNIAYEIGTNKDTSAVLSDGATFDVPRGVTIVIDAGAVLKFAGTNINIGSFAQNVDRSGSSIQVLGTPSNNVIFTSYYDQTIGTKTNALDTVATSSDWGGISIRNDLDYEFINSYDPSSGKKQREVLEEQGIFLNYISNGDFRYGGGKAVGVDGTYTPINLNATRATITYNTITKSGNAAISADLSSFEETRFQSWDHDANTVYTLDYTRIGPEIYGNVVANNSVNGLAIRAKATTTSSSPQKVTGNIRFDDTDIVHVIQENIVLQGTTGEYATTPVTAPSLSDAYAQFGNSSTTWHSSASNEANDVWFDNTIMITGTPADGEYFSLSDGTTTLVFEFNHIDKVNHGGVRQGRVQVDINSTDSSTVVMNKLIAVINSFSDATIDPVTGKPMYLSNYAGNGLSSTDPRYVQALIPNGGDQMVKPFKITATAHATSSGTIVFGSTGTELEILGTGLVKASKAGQMVADPGIIFKSLDIRIEAEMGAQIIAEGNAAHQIVFTSLYDDRFGASGSYVTATTTGNKYLPKAGNWGGIFFDADSKGSLDYALIAFAGGISGAEGGNVGFNPVEIHQADVRIANSRFEHNTGVVRGDSGSTSSQLGRGSATPAVIFVRGAQPVIINNEFFNNTNGLSNNANALSVVSINVNSLTDESVRDWGRSTGPVSNYSEYNDNYGALVRNNTFTGNSVNGMVVRGEVMTVSGIWDDADIAHILYNEIKVPNYHSGSGLRLMSAPGQSLVVKLLGANAGFTTLGVPLDDFGRIGGSIQIIGVSKYPVVLTSLKDDSVGAGRNLKGQVMFDTNNDRSNSSAAPGDWRSVKFDSYSNDRNVLVITELEKNANESEDKNGTTALSQYLGRLAIEDKAGDDVYHLGYEIYGSIRSDAANEADVYSFTAKPGTEIWIDIDKTSRDLDLIIEVIDANGNLLARSDNGFMEEYGFGEVETFEGVQAFTMNKDRWNRMDFYTINQRDPGLRFVTPGTPDGEEKTYYVRVRSALAVTDVADVNSTNSNGEYFTISQGDKTYTFVFDYNRDATDAAYLNATKVNGHFIVPMKGVANTDVAKQKAIVDAINKTYEVHAAKAYNDNYGQGAVTARIAYFVDGNNYAVSYIVLDGVELDFIAHDTGLTHLANSSGNYRMQLRLQETDEVPGCSVMYADIRYAVNGVEANGFPQNSPILAEYKDIAGNSFDNAGDLGNLLGSNSGTVSVSGYMTSISQVDWYKFSLNYRDIQMIAGTSNAGNIWSAVFDIDYADKLTRPDLTLWVFDSGGHLIYIGTDSNVADDQYDPNLTSSIEKLSAGSSGTYDPFIGPAGLTAGVEGGSSQTYYVAVTNAATFADVLNHTNTRVEPVDSIRRIVEERVDQGQDMDEGWNDTEIEMAQRLILTPDEYNLSDVVTYIGTNGGLYMIDPFTGTLQLQRSYNTAFPGSNEIELRDNGKLYTFGGNGNIPNMYEINQAQVTSQVASISTQVQGKWYYLNNTTVVWNDSSYTVQAFATSNYGSTYSSNNYQTQGYTLSIGSVSGFSQSFYDSQTGAIGNNNVMFLHSADGVGVSRDRTSGLDSPASSGTNQACSSSLIMTQFTENNGLRSNSEIITSMTQGNDGIFYVVTNAGNLYAIENPLSRGWTLSTNVHYVGDTRIEVPAMRATGSGASLRYIGTCKDDAGVPLTLSGISAGPVNVENGVYANKLFITSSSDNRLRVITLSEQNSVGAITYSPVFYGGATSVAIPANSNSITFSPIDYNLWHRTSLDTDPVQTSPSLVRTGGDDSYPHNATGEIASWYFGLENPTTSNIWRDTQPGAGAYENDLLTGNEESWNTYNVPGGAYGSLTSNAFSLDGYAPEDKPALYFTYKTDSDSTGSFQNSNDLPAVFISVDGGAWQAIAVGNAYSGSGNNNSYWNRTNEAQYNSNGELLRQTGHYIDVLENVDEWRQAKVDLSEFAGNKDIRLKFVFSTAQGDVSLGAGVAAGNSAGTLITPPTADQLLDSGWRANNPTWTVGGVQVPGDGSQNYNDNGYYTIGTKTFRFVSGYSIYVPAAPGEYGDKLTLTINGKEIVIPIAANDSSEQVLQKIIDTVRIEFNGSVIAKRYVDSYDTPTGSMLYFEDADTLEMSVANSGGFVLIGGPQDRTLEEIFAMTAGELATFLNQPVIPVPFRADMTQSQIAGSIAFMTNLAFNELLNTELNQSFNSTAAIPHVENLLNTLQNMLPNDNVINIINTALGLVRTTGSTKAISFLVSLIEQLNVEGKYNSMTGTGVVPGLEAEVATLYRESAALARFAATTLRDGSTLNDAQRNAFNTAINSLTAVEDDGATNPDDILLILQNALTGNDANVTAARNGVAAIRQMVTDYLSIHHLTNLQSELTALSGMIPADVFARLDNFSQNLLSLNPQNLSDIILTQLAAYRVTWNQSSVPVTYLNMLDTLRIDIANNPESTFVLLRDVLDSLAALPDDVPAIVTNNLQSTLNRVSLYYTSAATILANSLNAERNILVSQGYSQDILDAFNVYRAAVVANPENVFTLLDDMLAELEVLRTSGVPNADRVINTIEGFQERTSNFFFGAHVTDDLDALSVRLKAIARTTAINAVNELLNDLRSHVAENAVATINRVLNTNLNSTDPRLLVTLFQQSGSLLEKNLRLDTSDVGGVTGPTSSFVTNLPSTTNSIQLSLVNVLSVGHAGPLNVQDTVLDGTRDNGLTRGGSLDAIYRSQDNLHTGIFIDNIIIGFASRGEMVTNAPSNTSFTTVPAEAGYVRTGSYQLEIRRGTEYATYSAGFRSAEDAQIWTLFDINERHNESLSFFAPSAAQVAHNQKFSISDGVTTLTFVFIHSRFGGGSGDDIKIIFNDSDTNVSIANKIKAAINTAFQNGLFKVTAMTGSMSSDITKTHYLVDLFNATDFQNLTVGATPIKHVFYGASTAKQINDGTITGYNGNEAIMQSTDLKSFLANTAASRLYVDPALLTRTGDENTSREKGQLNLYGNSITYSSDYAIKIMPGENPAAIARQQADYRIQVPLVPGIAITNNVLAFNNTGAISIEGQADAIPFVRILNNTIYGNSVAVGTGISLGANTAATIMNNIFANLNTGIAINGANSNEMVYRSNTYRGNNTNGEDTSSGNPNRAEQLDPNEPLFVNEARGNFYPATNSQIIDSATETFEERKSWYNSTLARLGIPESKIISPQVDMYGQLRSYDENTSGGGTGGSNPGLDRGAIERVDFEKPSAALGIPHDVTSTTGVGKTGDQDPNRNDIYLIAEYYNRFTIQLSDVGIGIDDLSVADTNGFVHEHVITVIESTWDGTQWVAKTLTLNSDYFANYNTANDLITLTPNRGQWSSDARYTIIVNNGADGVCDLAGNALMANRSDGTVTFNIVITGYDYGDAPDPKYPTFVPSDGPRHVVYHGYHLGDRVSVDYSPNASTNADADTYDDGVKLTASDLVTGKENTFLVKISDINEAIKTARGSGTTIGWLNIWIDWDDSGDFNSTTLPNGYKEYYQFEITQDMLDAADEDGYIKIKIEAPRYAANGTTELGDSYVFARFRFSSEKNLGPNGEAPNGEVEDYMFHMVQYLKTFGDAPKEYTPDGTMDGWHTVDLLWGYDKNDPTKPILDKASELVPGSGKQLYLGDIAPTSKSKPNYSDKANGNGAEDDGVDFTGLWFVAGEQLSFKVKVNVPEALKAAMTKDSSIKLYLNAWFDTNCDKTWGSHEHLLDNFAFGLNDIDANGYVTVSITIPNDAQRGETFARLRLSTSQIDSPYGPELTSGVAYDGEIEDFVINALDKRRDFGNAPGAENTLYDNGGAAHAIVRDSNGVPQLALGTKVDEDIDGRPALDFADYFANKPADNDGLVDCRLVIGEKSFLILTVTNTTTTDAYLNVWIDLNNNGKFDDVSEQIVKDILVKAGTVAGTQMQINLDATTIPAELLHVADDPATDEDESVKETIAIGEKFMRMRLSHQAGIGPRGSSIGDDAAKVDIDGEVEDYVIVLQKATANISGNIFQDLNADGTRQTIIPPTEEDGEPTGFDEAGLEGLIVYVDINGDGKFGPDQFGELEPYAITDADGHYEVKGLWNSIYDEKYKVRVLKDASDLAANTGLDQTVIDAYKALLTDYNEYILSSLIYQYEVSVTSTDAIENQNFAFFAKPRLSINDIAIVEGDMDDATKPVQTEIEMEITMANKYGTNIMVDVWVAYDTILTTLGLRLTEAGLSYKILVADAATGDFIEVTHAADAFTTDADDNVTINEGWLKLVGGEYATYTGKIKLVILGDIVVERDEAFNVDLSTDSYVDLLKNLKAEDGSAVASIILTKGSGQVVIINNDGDLNKGTAPEPYGPTQIEDGGARHQKDSDMRLGSSDSIPDGLKGYGGSTSTGYVTMDQFQFVVGVGNRLQATVNNTTGKQAYLIAWMDFDGDGEWDTDTEQIIGTNNKGIAVGNGTNTFTVTLPNDVALGETYIRFRLSSDETTSIGGMALDGEVEDYKVIVVSELLDRGSAPESYGDVSHRLSMDSNGNITGPYLGKTVRPEYLPDYRPTAGAPDDDGVKIPTYSLNSGVNYINALSAGQYERNENGDIVLDKDGKPIIKEYGITTITIEASQAGRISLWVDLNGNGVFDNNERVQLRINGTQTSSLYLDLQAGTNSIDVLMPESGLVNSFYTFARFRFTDRTVDHSTLTPIGNTVNGEVEDYLVTLLTQNSTVSGTVYHDMNADGKYGEIELPTPEVIVMSNKGAVIPFVSSSYNSYNSYEYMPGISSYPTQLPTGFQIQSGGKAYDSFIVTDKGAVMLLNYQEYLDSYYTYIDGNYYYYGYQSVGVPSLYSGDHPTFAPFLSNMVSNAAVYYEYGTDADGNQFVKIMWGNDFGICITDYPVGDDTDPDYVEGDIVTFYYSEAFIERLRVTPGNFSPVQVGTNYGSNYTARNAQTYSTHAALMNYFNSLRYTSVLNPDYVDPNAPVDPDNPIDPDAPVEPQYLQGAEKQVTYRLNPELGDYIYQGALPDYTAQLPTNIVLPESLGWYYRISTSSSASGTRWTDVQSFGFIFEYGGQRYSSYRISDRGDIGLVNAQGAIDAQIILGSAYVSKTPTVDKIEGVSANGNKFVQIRWDSSFGIIIENDPAGDIVSLFYTSDAYTNGVLLGGANENSYVYTDPSAYGIGFTYSDGTSVNVLPEIIGKSSISNRSDFDLFYSKSNNGQFTYRLSATTGKLFHYEPSLQGVKVYIDNNNNGQWDEGEVYTRSDALGNYTFTNLYPGDYNIRQDIVNDSGAGYVSTANNWIQTEPKDNGGYKVSVTEQGTNSSNNFGNFRKGNVSITDTKVIEGTGSNIYAEVEVELRDAFGAEVTFEYVTQDGNAVKGTDYVGGSGSATIKPQLAPTGKWTVRSAITSATNGQYDRSVSGDFLAYEEYDKASDQWKVYIYDAVNDKMFNLTKAIGHSNDDRMPSIVQTDDGILRLVWSSYNPTLKSYQIYYSEASVNNLEEFTNNVFQQGDTIYSVSDILSVTKEGDNVSPQISVYQKGDGGYDAIVSWFCTTKAGKKEIFYIDSIDAIKNGLYSNIKQVTNNNVEETQVTLDGKNIIWIQGGATNSIWYYQVGTSTNPVKIDAGVGSSSYPTVSGDYIVWQQTVNPGTTSAQTKIMYYQISTAKVFEINYGTGVSTLRGGTAPCIDGAWLVWQEPSGVSGKNDIMAYNVQSKVLRNLSINNVQDDLAPQVVGNRVVWRSYISEVYGETAEWQIRFVDLDVDGFIPVTLSESTTTDFNPLLTDKMIVWHSTHNVNGINKIMVATQEEVVIKSTFQIEIIANDIVESDKDFNVTLTGIKNNLADLSGKTTGVVTILNDDGGEYGFDYGDAPASYVTLLADDGPRHVISYTMEGGKLVPIALHKGGSTGSAAVDAETNGRPNANATGDNTNVSNDEEGVELIDSWVVGDKVCIKVYATTSCYLNMWVDWNGNGQFGNMATGIADSGEHVLLSRSSSQAGSQYIDLFPGENTLWFDIPADAKSGLTFARFRVSSEKDLKWFGSALDGEVEDYAVTVTPQGNVSPDKLAYVDGDKLVIWGTAMADTISIVRNADNIKVTHNGNVSNFSMSQYGIRYIDVNGRAGNDVIEVTGWNGEKHNVVFNPFEATITSDTLDITIAGAENIKFIGTSGLDEVRMYDSLGNDIVELSPNEGSMTNDSFTNSVEGVKRIAAYSARGGNDSATLNGWANKADQLLSRLNAVDMYDADIVEEQSYFNRATGFSDVLVNADAGRNFVYANESDKTKNANNPNIASVLVKNDAAVRFEANPQAATLDRGATSHDLALLLGMNSFNTINVSSLGGTNGRAILNGSDGADTLVATDTQIRLNGLRNDGANYSIQVNNFSSYSVNGGAGKDSASYTSSKNGDHLLAILTDEQKQELLLFSNGNFDSALLELIAFESAKMDSATTKATKDLRNFNKALIELELKGTWDDKHDI